MLHPRRKLLVKLCGALLLEMGAQDTGYSAGRVSWCLTSKKQLQTWGDSSDYSIDDLYLRITPN